MTTSCRTVYTILGCGSSPGVPRIGNDWGVCDPREPKNERLRCSFLIERFNAQNAVTRVLVDASPDLRAQMLRHQVSHLDAVLFTHAHADHVHGIDDLRAFWIRQRHKIDTYADKETAKRLHEAFGYCYKTPPESSYPPILNDYRITPYKEVVVSGAAGKITALPFEQSHGDIKSLGFRFGNVAYSSDVNSLDETAYKALRGVKVWIVDALRYKPHPSHFSVNEALHAASLVKAERTILTHMHIDLDFSTLLEELPKGVEPAYDGLVIEEDDLIC